MDANEAMAVIKRTAAQPCGADSFANAVYTLFYLMRAEELKARWATYPSQHPLSDAAMQERAATAGVDSGPNWAKAAQTQVQVPVARPTHQMVINERDSLRNQLATSDAACAATKKELNIAITNNCALNAQLRNERSGSSFLRSVIEDASRQHNNDAQVLAEITKHAKTLEQLLADGEEKRATIVNEMKELQAWVDAEPARRQQHRDEGARTMRSKVAHKVNIDGWHTAANIVQNTLPPSASDYA